MSFGGPSCRRMEPSKEKRDGWLWGLRYIALRGVPGICIDMEFWTLQASFRHVRLSMYEEMECLRSRPIVKSLL